MKKMTISPAFLLFFTMDSLYAHPLFLLLLFSLCSIRS
ncbi:hypothetical protein GBL_1964 [Geobacillus kaustophilus GBlys]|uniref:Uncharacterized protein n=1 Tax=Geobacillus kaustophilus GBlys TaxID=1337888 RepID=U2X4W3_GEOKU|nr:hypothetical protein GBL_1964 [Geobacillus kaustophilus GBlys]GAJ60236.1 hypothetical protein B23_3474 [Geobacillus thermoleovorans B23]